MDVEVINARFLKPLDDNTIIESIKKTENVITIEDGTINGGLFSAISEYFTEINCYKKLYHIAIPDQFVEHGDIPNLYHNLGFDVDSMVQFIKKCYGSN